MTEETMQIGKLADRTGMSIRSLRHYDEIGLLVPSARTEGGFRLYTFFDDLLLLLIRRMKPLGYSLEQMRELLIHKANAAYLLGLNEQNRQTTERQREEK